jgi:lysophospholipid acyltransferase (LPLAT)-like uncharacterized protein
MIDAFCKASGVPDLGVFRQFSNFLPTHQRNVAKKDQSYRPTADWGFGGPRFSSAGLLDFTAADEFSVANQCAHGGRRTCADVICEIRHTANLDALSLRFRRPRETRRDATMKIRSRFVNWMIAKLGTWALKALFLTVRVDHRKVVEDGTPYQAATGSIRYCFCIWHDAILTAVFSSKTYKLSGLISRHQDGSYLSDAVQMVGIIPVRGSASRGGAQATKQLIDQPDLHVCITPDGPRGPRRIMKDGIVFLASRTGRPIVPTTLTASSYWSIPGGWSDMLVPKPFSKALLLAGAPIEVPAELTREQISEYAELVQKEMDRMDLIGQRIIRGDESMTDLIGQTGAYPNDHIDSSVRPSGGHKTAA